MNEVFKITITDKQYWALPVKRTYGGLIVEQDGVIFRHLGSQKQYSRECIFESEEAMLKFQMKYL